MGLTCPYIFTQPLPPNLAASQDGRFIDPDIITESAHQLADDYDLVIMETCGGLFAPLQDDTHVIDYIGAQGWTTLLVATPAAGGISHTLALLETISFREIPLHGMVYNLNGCDSIDARVIDDGRRVLDRHLERIGQKGRICDLPAVSCTESYCVDFSSLF
jgi:dethiobiotin synthetase